MTVYDSNRVLTIRELHDADILHGGMLAGRCVKWAVIERDPTYAILKVGETLVKVTGVDLRRFEFFFAAECPNCALENPRIPSKEKDLYVVAEGNIESPDIPSTWRFKQAQFVKRRKIS